MDKLRDRVSNAETQLKGVRAENQRLRQDKVTASTKLTVSLQDVWGVRT